MTRACRSARLAGCLLIPIVFVLVPIFSFVQPASASDDSSYLTAIHNRPLWTQQNPSYDDWGFASRNSTSYVAYRLRNNGTNLHSTLFVNVWGKAPNGKSHWGNANEWDDYATSLGYVVDSVPAVGSVAQW